MADWFDDNSFWNTFQDYMFNPSRIDSARIEVDRIVALLNLASSARVLDLCCGLGCHSLELARRGFAATGVDRTEAYLEQACAIAGREGLQVEFV